MILLRSIREENINSFLNLVQIKGSGRAVLFMAVPEKEVNDGLFRQGGERDVRQAMMLLEPVKRSSKKELVLAGMHQGRHLEVVQHQIRSIIVIRKIVQDQFEGTFHQKEPCFSGRKRGKSEIITGQSFVKVILFESSNFTVDSRSVRSSMRTGRGGKRDGKRRRLISNGVATRIRESASSNFGKSWGFDWFSIIPGSIKLGADGVTSSLNLRS